MMMATITLQRDGGLLLTGTVEHATEHTMLVRFPGVGAANTFRTSGNGIWLDEIGVEWRAVELLPGS